MKLRHIARKLVDNRITRPIAAWGVRQAIKHSSSRSTLNRLYSTLSDDHKEFFYSKFAKSFRNSSNPGISGNWTIEFNGLSITLPLRNEMFWLDWDLALSVLGHDHEIKRTYSYIMNSTLRPALFVDIGANYGSHSLLFLAAGIPTMSFEPNVTCFEYFEICCKMNGLDPNWLPVALGEATGSATLTYPERDTWLGSIVHNDIGQNKLDVTVRTLNSYLPDIGEGNILTKIDTEGGELSVLKGAREFIRLLSPKIIFESNNDIDRDEIFRIMSENHYEILALPYLGKREDTLSPQQFLESRCTNFIALPDHARY